MTLAARLPRPNPDPELPPTPEGPALLWLGLVILIGLSGLIGYWFRRTRGRRDGGLSPPTELDVATPEVVRIAAEARQLLVRRFDASWAALTTEQIAGRPELLVGLGPEVTAGLLELLRAADRHKFGAIPDADADGMASADLGQWASVLAGLRAAAAGASSTTTGR